MDKGDYVKIIAGDHEGVCGQIRRVSKSKMLLFVDFPFTDKGWDGAAFNRDAIQVLTRKEYFMEILK